MMKRVFASMMTGVLVLGLAAAPHLSVQAVDQSEVDQAIASQGYYFSELDGGSRLNTDQNDEKLGNEQRMIYLTDPITGERIDKVKINGEYILHCLVVNDGTEQEPLTDVSVMIGQGDTYYEVAVNALVSYTDCSEYAGGTVCYSTSYPVVDRSADVTGDGWARFVATGKAKLYNQGGRLNGAWVNHKALGLTLSSVPDRSGIKLGYDDQDGYLPYGKEYACEIRVPVKLSADNWYHWSDPVFAGEYTGRTIDEKGQLVDID